MKKNIAIFIFVTISINLFAAGGQLTLEVSPEGTQIFVNDNYNTTVTNAPVNLYLPLGNNKLSLIKDGFESKTLTIYVTNTPEYKIIELEKANFSETNSENNTSTIAPGFSISSNSLLIVGVFGGMILISLALAAILINSDLTPVD